jgi:hypothetical protein
MVRDETGAAGPEFGIWIYGGRSLRGLGAAVICHGFRGVGQVFASGCVRSDPTWDLSITGADALRHSFSVRPELVEGLSFPASVTEEGEPFDKLRANGVC